MDRSDSVPRRNALKLLAGATLAPAVELAQEPGALTTEDVRGAADVAALPLSKEQLQTLTPALRHHLEGFQLVRDLDIDDSVPPAIHFISR